VKITPEDKQAVLKLCGTKGDTRKGRMFLGMMYENITDEEAKKTVEQVQAEESEARQ
jgi:hypothetical protein